MQIQILTENKRKIATIEMDVEAPFENEMTRILIHAFRGRWSFAVQPIETMDIYDKDGELL